MKHYFEAINRFWAKDAEYHFSDRETAFYFYLLNVCNSTHWKNPFGLSNHMTMAKFGWGKTSFDRARSRLKDAGLIDFRAGIGRGNIYRYIIKDGNSSRNHDSIQPDVFYGQFSEPKGIEKGTQSDTISGQFSEKGIEKGSQTDTFSEQFYSLKAAETGNFQSSQNEKHENNSHIYTCNNINNKDMDNKNKECEVKKEKSTSQKDNDVLELYRTVCRSFPQIMHITGRRKDKILRRLSEMGGMKILEQVFCKMEASDFLKGNNRTGWKATFDWVFKNSDNWMKILEGNYDNQITQKNIIQPANDVRFRGMLQTDLSKF